MKGTDFRFWCVVLMAVCFLFIVFWLICTIWTDSNPEWINKSGLTAIVILVVSYTLARASEDEL